MILIKLVVSIAFVFFCERSDAQKINKFSSQENPSITFDENIFGQILNDAQSDEEALRAGKEPLHVNRSEGDLADGGSILYRNKNYEIAVLKRMASLNGSRGWLQGREVTFFDKRYDQIGVVRFIVGENSFPTSRVDSFGKNLIIISKDNPNKDLQKIAKEVNLDAMAIMHMKPPMYAKRKFQKKNNQDYVGAGYKLSVIDRKIFGKLPGRIYGVKVVLDNDHSSLINIQFRKD